MYNSTSSWYLFIFCLLLLFNFFRIGWATCNIFVLAWTYIHFCGFVVRIICLRDRAYYLNFKCVWHFSRERKKEKILEQVLPNTVFVDAKLSVWVYNFLDIVIFNAQERKITYVYVQCYN